MRASGVRRVVGQFVALLVLAAVGCSRPTLAPADAQRAIEAHPRFREPQAIRVPKRFCRPPVVVDPSSVREPDPLEGLEAAGAVTTSRRKPSGDECASRPGADLVTVTLTDLASTFHPSAIADGRGWEFAVAHRRFVEIHDVDYDDPKDPKLAHVQYTWAWEPELLGQLLQIGTIAQGASATFLRDGNGWTLRQPGM